MSANGFLLVLRFFGFKNLGNLDLIKDFQLVLNPWKYHYMLISSGDQADKINLDSSKINRSNNEKLFDLLIDRKLSFKSI